ncbi:MAG TPA: Ig-like domain-containing protein [Candidatus Paceibacterota bacterium]
MNKKIISIFLAVAVIFSFLGSAFRAEAAATSAKFAGTAVDAADVMSIAWATPSNATGDTTATSTTATVNGNAKPTDMLRLTNFGFTASDIPSGSTINGVTVEVEWNTDASFADTTVQLTTDGTTGVGNNNGLSTTQTIKAFRTYGGAADGWGASLTQANVISSNFGVLLKYTTMAGGNNQSVNVYRARITINYTASDTTPPTVTNVTADHANGLFTIGELIPIQITFSEAVNVVTTGGTPALKLAVSSPVYEVSYSSGNGTTILTFNYTVLAGHNSSDSDYETINSLVLNGGTIKDGAGNNATLTLPSPGAAGSLGANKNIVIDTAAPAAFTTGAVVTTGGTVVAGFWNASNTGVNVTVPVANDSSLTGGTIVLEAEADGAYENVGSAYTILVGDLNTNKTLSITAAQLEAITGFSEGDNITFRAIITDLAGNGTTGSASADSLNVDQVAPAAPSTPDLDATDDTGTSNSDNITKNTTGLTFTGTAEADSTVELFDGVTSKGTTTATGGNWSFDISLTEGAHSITAKATDAAGNTSAASGALSITIDASAPAAPSTPDLAAADDTGSSDSDNITKNTTGLTFSGTAEASSIVELFDGVDSKGTATATGGNWSFDISLTEGVHSITAKATDAAGNTSSASGALSVTIDASTPTLAEVTPVSTPTNDPTPNYTFSTTETGSITYGGDCSSVTISATTGNNTITFNSLSDGAHSNCTIIVTDAAGNASTPLAVTSFTIDTAAPSVVLTSATVSNGGTTNAGTVSFTATFSESVSGFDVSDITVTNGTKSNFVPVSGLIYTFDVTPTGTSVSVSISAGVATDSATNQNTVSNTYTFTFDNTAPTLTITLADSDLTAGETSLVTFTFSESVAGTFTNTDITTIENGTLSPVVDGGAGTVWTATFTPTADIEDATNVITVTMTGLADLAGNPGVGTASSGNYTVNTVTALDHFLVEVSSPQTAGAPFDVTITAQDVDNATVTAFTGTAEITSTGTLSDGSGTTTPFTAGVLVHSVIISNTGSFTITATKTGGAETGTSAEFTVNAGPLDTFNIDTVSSPQTAGEVFDIVLTAKDANDNTITDFTSTVTLANDLGDIAPTTSDSFVAGVLTQSVTLIHSGLDFITATASGKSGSSNSFTVTSGPTDKFLLDDPGNMTAGTRIGYTVTREDAFGNLATVGIDTVYLYTNSGETAAFFDAAEDGNEITSIDIADGQSSAQFWYYDDNDGTWTITASDNATAPDGAAGIDDATDEVTVSVIPIVATKFIIIDPTDATVGDTVPITIKAVDNSNNVDTTYMTDVTLNTTGSATGGGIEVDIINGVGTINITDTVAETVTLSLSDTQSTGLDVSSTQDVIFSVGALDHFTFDPIDSQTSGVSFAITLTAKDEFENTTLSFSGPVNFSVTPSGSIAPLVSGSFTAGVLTENVTITLTLADNVAIIATFDEIESQSDFFSVLVEGEEPPPPPPPPPPSGGGGGAAPSVSISGSASPGTSITFAGFGADGKLLPLVEVTTTTGNFSLEATGLPESLANFYIVYNIDPDGNLTSFKTLTLEDLKRQDILFSPTIGLNRRLIRLGDVFSASGFATQGSLIEFEIDGQKIATTAIAGKNGKYEALLSTANLLLGNHSVRARQLVDGTRSDFSPNKTFTITNLFVPAQDFNQDGKVNIQDINIFLARYLHSNPEIRALADLNKDGIIDLSDFSIMLTNLTKTP